MTHRSVVTYKRKRTTSVTFQQFHCLTLDLNNTSVNASSSSSSSGGVISIEQSLQQYFSEEVKLLLFKFVVDFCIQMG